MRKSLFTKYFAICSTVVIISLTLLGAIMMVVAGQYFKTEKYTLLKNNTTSAVTFTVDNCVYDSDSKTATIDPAVQNTYALLASAIDAQLILVESNGKANLMVGSMRGDGGTTEEYGGFSAYTVSEKILSRMLQVGEYFEVGTLGGIYDSQYYTYGLPIRLDNGQLVGFLFASTPATAMTEFVLQVLQMFCLSSVFVIFLSFLRTSIVLPIA